MPKEKAETIIEKASNIDCYTNWLLKGFPQNGWHLLRYQILTHLSVQWVSEKLISFGINLTNYRLSNLRFLTACVETNRNSV